ncbi:regulator of G-protein signaling loco isoform X2 [Bactrocera dorsalis]|uniref:Regulator of G-protein signaling loco isoform X2 n=1 Tax=Bactrocera dorsalis TaxID=27457 RepID=A0ABM3J7K3_BACDO|nr:regulator of G-protein signaling loco isoform X2 [Bactrocera dorsalis]
MHHHHPLAPTQSNTGGASTSNNASVPALPNVGSINAGIGTAIVNNTSTSVGTTHVQQRRRKKRPNYGTRTVEVRRGYNGFGFTISGQQPCRLSCIVSNSPADQAGLRAGDFLISVNGLNVSKLPHETVVQLIGNSFGSIRMQIAENYYSDSSDEENAALMLQQQTTVSGLNSVLTNQLGLGVGGARAKPRYLHHKAKMHRLRNSPQKKRTVTLQQQQQLARAEQLSKCVSALKPMELQKLRPLIEDLPLPSNSSAYVAPSVSAPKEPTAGVAAASNSAAELANVNAMARAPAAALEYRAIVGYLGTIEMPKQISHSSKLQTVRSCIRKLRQEKRQPNMVLMTILPDCLRLQAANGNTLASYASERLNYVSSSSESENRFFGLVTSAVHTSQMDEDDEDDDDIEAANVRNGQGVVGVGGVPGNNGNAHVSISNSCHVFVVDTKLCEHQAHVPRAAEFRIHCTRDPISSLCLEFPNNSEYVVNLIRSMYTMRIMPPVVRHHAAEDIVNGYGGVVAGGPAAAAHSPQPSNHSEISTTTSNSDSGIGFHNDCNNISDRILVVDFPGAPELRMRPMGARPMGIFNNFDNVTDKRPPTVRAVPEENSPPQSVDVASTSNAHCANSRPNLLANFNLIKSPATSLQTTRSCDDVLALVERSADDGETAALDQQSLIAPHASMDDISLHSSAPSASTMSCSAADEHLFLHPAACMLAMQHQKQRPTASQVYALLQDCLSRARNARQSLPSAHTTTDGLANAPNSQNGSSTGATAASTKRHSIGFEASDITPPVSALNVGTFETNTWKSLQDLRENQELRAPHTPDGINSEPDLLVKRYKETMYETNQFEVKNEAFENGKLCKNLEIVSKHEPKDSKHQRQSKTNALKNATKIKNNKNNINSQETITNNNKNYINSQETITEKLENNNNKQQHLQKVQQNQKLHEKLLKHTPTTKPNNIANMVERFVETLSQINDSAVFDASFEIKHLPETPQRLLRHRCVTEVDRESLARFVRNFEARQQHQHQQVQQQDQQEQTQTQNTCRRNSSSARTTPKSSPYLCRKAKALYQNVFNGGNTSQQSSRSNSPWLRGANTPDTQSTHSDLGSADSQTHLDELTAAELMPAPKEQKPKCCSHFQRSQSERSSYRSAVKVLQFFSGKKKCKSNKTTAVAATTVTSSSPLPLRATALGCQPLPQSDVEDNIEDDYYFEGVHVEDYDDNEDVLADIAAAQQEQDEHDDGISSASSNITQSSGRSQNHTPDSSFELHSPLVPTFKVTPPQHTKGCRNPAYELARFLRGSFHTKRASVTKLRRSISDPDTFEQIDFTQPPTCHRRKNSSNSNNQTIKGVKSAEIASLAPAKNLPNSNLPANASPFRRAWGQSSFRTPRTDKRALQQLQLQQQSGQHQHLSPLVRRSSSMTASDNDVYIKSMHHTDCHDELKQTHSQHQIATSAAALVAARNTNAVAATTLTTTNATSNSGNSKVASCINQLKIPQLKTTLAPSADNGVGGVAAWGTAFERLLEDPAGMHTFAEFLKKEFSAENIYFWTACERYRALESSDGRAAQAMAIFSKHLANGALEPVNVDSQARNLTQEKLESAEPDIFAPAQKQIFNLMKFDSYQRFIRSDMYKSCVEAEEKRQPLPYKAEDLDELLRTPAHQPVTVSSIVSKLKKSASNAEDRCRKSLLPWHRKTSSSKAPRDNTDAPTDCKATTNKIAPLSSHSLKLAPVQNSQNDIHSSRSSLSSFDGLPGASILPGTCRVILSDASTTMVQARANETVGQLVERLLEKRGLCYQYYDVVAKGTTKSIDLQTSSQTLVGKDVLIEQRVAFKMDLPDRKVISVKSKPKKQLQEVVCPILHKYNYDIEAVQVVMRETQEPVDLSLTVTHADGQRLQAVWLKPPPLLHGNDYQNGNGCAAKVAKASTSTKSVSFPTALKQTNGGALRSTSSSSIPVSHSTQSALDEITNKVFTELMQVKVEAASAEKTQPLTTHNDKVNEHASLKSDDCASETSSIFERIRRRDNNIQSLKLKLKKRSTSSQHSEETNQSSHTTASNGQLAAPTAVNAALLDIKKPIIAKLKAGVKLQMPERVAENQDELLEGLKRAQLARLEDQRGTEINFELPDFLKNKENLNASKLRKARANLSPINKPPAQISVAATEEQPAQTAPQPTQQERPQPAPRLSITNKLKANATVSSAKQEQLNTDEARQTQPTTPLSANLTTTSLESEYAAALVGTNSCKGPPPLPPKPKVLPIKPSNWGAAACMSNSSTASTPTTPSTSIPTLPTPLSKNYTTVGLTNSVTTIVEDAPLLLHVASKHFSGNEIAPRKTHLSIAAEQPTSARCAYLEEPSSSFV